MKRRLLRWLLRQVFGRACINEMVMCLEGAVYCMTHDVMGSTRDFELRHIKDMIVMLKERR